MHLIVMATVLEIRLEPLADLEMAVVADGNVPFVKQPVDVGPK